MSRGFTFGVVLYVLFFMLLDHGYLQKEMPFVGIDLRLDLVRVSCQSFSFPCAPLTSPLPAAAQSTLNITYQSNVSRSLTGATNFNLTVAGPNGTASVLQQFPYCVAGTTDYVWDANATRSYTNNTCVPYVALPEMFELGSSNVWLYTYWRQSNWARTCVPSTDVPKYYIALPAGYPADTPNSVKDYDFNDPGFVPNCNTSQSIRNASVLLVQPERAVLTIRPTYSTTWGKTGSRMATIIQSRAGVATPLPGAVPLSFGAQDTVQITFKQLLALAGIDLDATNVLADGGRGPLNGTAYPTYRITGVTLIIDVVHHNFVENKTKLDPFNFQETAVLEVYPATKGTFASPGSRLFYTGHLYNLNKLPRNQRNVPPGTSDPYPYPESLYMVRHPQGVEVQFVANGLVGRFDGKVLLGSLINIFIMSAVAQTLTDLTAGFLINGFRAQKYMLDLELRIRNMLRRQLADSPGLEQVRMFENSVTEMYGNRAFQASMMRRLGPPKKDSAPAVSSELAAAAAGAGFGKKDVGAAAGTQVEERQDFQSVGAALRSAPVGVGRAMAGDAAGDAHVEDFAPRVVQLLISGQPCHGQWLTAQGYLENCRCVRFQWYRTFGGAGWEAIPFATMPSFFPTADDVGCLIAVDAVPVTDDGFEGPMQRVRIGPLTTMAEVTARVEELVEEAQHNEDIGVTFDDGVSRAGDPGLLIVRKLDICLKAAQGHIDFGRVPTQGCRCDLDRRDPGLMTVVAAFGGDAAPSLGITFESPEERDVAALVIRLLSQGKTSWEPTLPGPDDVPTDDE